MVIFSDTTEKECVKKRHPLSIGKIRLVQHCAAISATAELYAILEFCCEIFL